jgi:single-stranded-DNA-specific exonuclease
MEIFISKRKDPRGVSENLVGRVLDSHDIKKIDLVITSDHGSSDNERFKILKENGIKVVATDHHEIPEDNFPYEANVFVNNQRKDSTIDKGLSGCYVAFLTMVSTYEYLHKKKYHKDLDMLLPYVALTTISDVMPLDSLMNRNMMKYGLREMNKLTSPVWRAMKNQLGIVSDINEVDIGFRIAPLINAASRLFKEEEAFEALIADDFDKASVLVKRLVDLNNERKKMQKDYMKQCTKDAIEYKYENSIVLHINTDIAINGIIGGNIGENFNKPIVVFAKGDSGEIVGSGRSIREYINLRECFKKIHEKDGSIIVVKDNEPRYGGHKLAAGVTIYEDKIEDFKKIFDEVVTEYSPEGDLPKDGILVDMVLDGKHIDSGLIEEVNRFSPYGKSWPKPLFVTEFEIVYLINFGRFCKMKLKTSCDKVFEGKWMINHEGINPDNVKDILERGRKLVVIYSINGDNYNNKYTMSLDIDSIRLH